MKIFTKSLIAGAMLSSALLTTTVQAADQKIGVVDVQGVVRALPQFAEISQVVTTEFKDQVQEFNAQREELSFLDQKYKRESATMSDEQKKQLEAQIIALDKTIQEKAGPLQQNIQRRQQEEQNKLLGLVSQAVQKIAKDSKYDLVINSGAALYAKPEFDITQQVLESVSKIQ